eukprot:380632-Amphidinium_carterae.1
MLGAAAFDLANLILRDPASCNQVRCGGRGSMANGHWQNEGADFPGDNDDSHEVPVPSLPGVHADALMGRLENWDCT